MKFVVFGCLLALAAYVSCIGNDPLLVVPYCIDTQNAYLTRDGDYVDFTDITVSLNTGNPIFVNGQNYGRYKRMWLLLLEYILFYAFKTYVYFSALVAKRDVLTDLVLRFGRIR